ncbi:MAG: hypothetical protein K2X87_28900 [Gemmataceae bacterium]|nr:hypothetical protein [Gemmataceae bacterium]
MAIHRIAVVLLLLVCVSPSVGAQDPVDELTRNYPAIPRGSFTATTRMGYDPKSPLPTVRVGHIYFDPPRWKVLDRGSTTSMQDGRQVTNTSQGEEVISAAGEISVSADPKTGRALSGVSAYVRPLPPELLQRLTYGPYSLALDGRTNTNGFIPLPELIRDGRVKTEPTPLNGKPAVLVESAGRWGRLNVWLDPANGYLPVRIAQEKSAGDLIYEGVPVGSVTKDEDGKPVKLTSWKQEYNISRINKVGAGRMVTEFRHTATNTYADGSTDDLIEEVSISDIKVVDRWDKDPFVLSTIVPDGTKVSVWDDQPIQYEWRGGKIVKTVNQAVAQGEVSPFTPASHTPWWVYAGAAAGLVAVAGGVWRLAARRGAAA